MMALHDREFNDMWLRAWTRRQVGFGISLGELDKIKDQVRLWVTKRVRGATRASPWAVG